MQKIVIIIAVTTIPLITIIGGLYFFGSMQKDRAIDDAIAGIEDPYYRDLAQQCDAKDDAEYKCCLSSVYEMIGLDALLATEKECENLAIDELRCLGSYKWCVPLADVTMSTEDIMDNDNDHKACEVNDDCVPATCCHATEVINKKFAPNCDGMMCTMSCETVLDCGQGEPVCKDGICEIEVK